MVTLNYYNIIEKMSKGELALGDYFQQGYPVDFPTVIAHHVTLPAYLVTPLASVSGAVNPLCPVPEFAPLRVGLLHPHVAPADAGLLRLAAVAAAHILKGRICK